MHGIYQPECPPSVISLLIPEEASAVCTPPCIWLCAPVTQGRCGTAGSGGEGGMQQKGASKRETLCISFPPPPSHSPHLTRAHGLASQLLGAQRHLGGCSAESSSGPPEKACEKERARRALPPPLWPVERLLRDRLRRAALFKPSAQNCVAHSTTGIQMMLQTRGVLPLCILSLQPSY